LPHVPSGAAWGLRGAAFLAATMANFKARRQLGGTLLYVATFGWLAAWLAGWFWLDNPDLTEPAFYVFWIFLAASLIYMGLRGAIEEY